MFSFRRTLFPLFLLSACPAFVLLVWHALTAGDGRLSALLEFEVMLRHFGGTPRAWAMIAAFAAFELILMRVLPGTRVEGPPTPSGHVPVYTANGPLAFAVTLAAWFGLTLPGVVHGGIVYDEFGNLLGALDVLALGVCLGLYLKGRFAPSAPAAGSG